MNTKYTGMLLNLLARARNNARQMDLEERVGSPTVNSKLIPYHGDPGLESTSYGTNEGENALPIHRFRLRTVVYSCVVAIQAWFVYGYSIGYTSPILSDLDSANSTYASLHKSIYQDIFSVRSNVAIIQGVQLFLVSHFIDFKNTSCGRGGRYLLFIINFN